MPTWCSFPSHSEPDHRGNRCDRAWNRTTPGPENASCMTLGNICRLSGRSSLFLEQSSTAPHSLQNTSWWFEEKLDEEGSFTEPQNQMRIGPAVCSNWLVYITLYTVNGYSPVAMRTCCFHRNPLQSLDTPAHSLLSENCSLDFEIKCLLLLTIFLILFSVNNNVATPLY